MQLRILFVFWAASTHCWLSFCFSCTIIPQVLLPQSALILRIVLTQVKDLAFGLVELPGLPRGLLLQPVRVLLDVIPSLEHYQLHHSAWCICKFPERLRAPRNPTGNVINQTVLTVPVQALERHHSLLVSTWTLSRGLELFGCSHSASSIFIQQSIH